MYSIKHCLNLAKGPRSTSHVSCVTDYIVVASGELFETPLPNYWSLFEEHEIKKYLLSHAKNGQSLQEVWELLIDKAYDFYSQSHAKMNTRIFNSYERQIISYQST